MLHQVPIGVHVLIAERLHCLGSALPSRRVRAPHVSASRTDPSRDEPATPKAFASRELFLAFHSFLFPL